MSSNTPASHKPCGESCVWCAWAQVSGLLEPHHVEKTTVRVPQTQAPFHWHSGGESGMYWGAADPFPSFCKEEGREGVEAEVGGRMQGPRETEDLQDSLVGGILGEEPSPKFKPSSSSLTNLSPPSTALFGGVPPEHKHARKIRAQPAWPRTRNPRGRRRKSPLATPSVGAARRTSRFSPLNKQRQPYRGERAGTSVAARRPRHGSGRAGSLEVADASLRAPAARWIPH